MLIPNKVYSLYIVISFNTYVFYEQICDLLSCYVVLILKSILLIKNNNNLDVHIVLK